MIEDSFSSSLFEATRLFFQKVASRGEEEREEIVRTLYAAAGFHANQHRKSGELFIIHPIQVATIVASYGADTPTVQAALLHDVLEDTEVSAEELQKQFGKEVYQLVEAVTKQPMFSTKEFLEKVYAKSRLDPRVAWIKIADQCTNHLHGSQMVFSLAKHQEHLQEMEEFYLTQLATIPYVPKELVKLLTRITNDSKQLYHNRSK